MSSSMKLKTIEALRWVAVLPGAVAATGAYNIAYSFCGDHNFGPIFDGIFEGAFDGMIFVFIGSMIAPRYRPIVSIILATFICTLLAVLTTYGISVAGWHAEFIGLLSLAGGTVVGCVATYQDFAG